MTLAPIRGTSTTPLSSVPTPGPDGATLTLQIILNWSATELRFYKPASETLRRKFEVLAKQWHKETDYLSSPAEIATNQNYLAVIALGEPAIPLILTDLKKRGGEWYRALIAIARSIGIDPPTLTADDLADSRRVDQVWLLWGRQHGYTV